jgi:dimeric dUTPase (all-alpha-NTP-PPase superfamily)
VEGTLQMVLDKQKDFQSRFGYSGEETDIKTVSSLIHTHSAFVIEEIYEMLRELPYHKPWKDYSDWNSEKIVEQFEIAREEWIDVFIFVMNVGLFLGFDENLIRKMYLEKLGINHKRQEDPELGYVIGGKQ